MSATAPVRGCGVRQRGGIYLEVLLSPDGLPLEHFLCDPPQPLPDRFPLAPQGVQIVARPAGTVVFDWVGQEHYPNVADILEEGRCHGFSRRVPRSTDFARLRPPVWLALVHALGATPDTAYADLVAAEGRAWRCPTGKHRGGEGCAGVWWEDVTGGEPVAGPPRAVVRTVGSTRYHAYGRPLDWQPAARPAVVAVLPLSRIAVIADPVSGRHEAALAAASAAGLPVILEDA